MHKQQPHNLEIIVRMLKSLIPGIDDTLAYIEDNQGWIPLKEEFISNLYSSGLWKWSEFYLDKTKFKALTLLNFYTPDELNNIKDYRGEKQNLIHALTSFLESDELDNLPTADETKEAINSFFKSTQEKQEEISHQTAIYILSFLTNLFNYMALMVHGRSMCDLVRDAINGDDKAFALAVQIDRTVLNLPYFQERMLKAQLDRDPAFLDQLSYRLRNPILRGKIRYRTLWITFAILDDEGLLSLPHDELLDICEQVGVYGEKFGIEDVGHLSSRLREYRRLQTK